MKIERRASLVIICFGQPGASGAVRPEQFKRGLSAFCWSGGASTPNKVTFSFHGGAMLAPARLIYSQIKR
jgi:hypothetical protein